MVVVVSLVAVGGCGLDQKIHSIPSPPLVLLSGPTAALRQDAGVQALFSGEVSDRHDAPGELVLSWQLDDQDLGEPFTDTDGDGHVALTLEAVSLSVGWHTLRLTAIDNDAHQDSAVVDVEIQGPTGAPTVRITAPGEGARFWAGETIPFQGQAEDSATPPEDLAFAWASSLDGSLGDGLSDAGQAVLITSLLSVGQHEITLVVADQDGEWGQDMITILIEEEIAEPKEEAPIDAEPGDLVLSEFMVNPSVVNDTSGEWFELYNTSDLPIEITGYTLRDEDYDEWVITEEMVIPPHDFFVVCADMNPLNNGGVESCDAWFLRPQLPPPGLAFGNEGDELILVRPDGVEIDRLEYDAAWVETAKATGVDPDYLDSDNNDILSNWCPQTTVITSGGEPGTPGMRNDPCP